MVVDFIQQQRNVALLPLQMNGGSLTMKLLRECLENLVLRKCLQTRVTITLMTLTLWKSSVHVLHLCLFRILSYHVWNILQLPVLVLRILRILINVQ